MEKESKDGRGECAAAESTSSRRARLRYLMYSGAALCSTLLVAAAIGPKRPPGYGE